MDTGIFIEELYQEGKKLIECLDKEGYKYPIAMWSNIPEDHEWELLLGIPRLDVDGSRKSALSIYDTINKYNIKLTLSNLKLVDTHSELCTGIKSRITTGMSLDKIVFTGRYINGRSFPDSIIYRVN